MRIELEPIGVMRTPYRSKYDAPRQPGVLEDAHEAFIDMYPHKNFEQALHDLCGFDRIWILSWFDRVGGWKPKVLPPRSSGKRGVFATRSPHRPNPIGLSVAVLKGIEGLRIVIADSDLLDGTPVLDIKPYLPYADSFPDAAIGWLASESRASTFAITYTAGVFDEVNEQGAERLRIHIERVLGLDPLPHPYRRTRRLGDNRYVLAIRNIRVYYNLDANTVTVTFIEEQRLEP
ncbi:MAG: tRNA (N6-threonylcarbamoyladenosine(37)-N6)-methyltransferase TrmO [bacterium]|nr:tRNA (N6-threonylcarbamoyladenosine(37)-N6)-methyltransferase TrmO [bacterium]